MMSPAGISGAFMSVILVGASGSLQSATPAGPLPVNANVAGEIALQEHDLQKGRTIGYRPWFNPGSGQGDLVEYMLGTTGALDTDVDIDASPPTPGSAGGCSRPAAGCWSARAGFFANGADDPHSHYWQQRKLFTGNHGQVDFAWDRLGPGQQALLDNATAARSAIAPGAWDSDILNYIRGQRLHEQQNALLPGSSGKLRNRTGVLGNIPATPAYIGPARELLGHVDGYRAFAAASQNRPGRIAAGANDGMLHVFDAADGSEVYAYIPSMLLKTLGRLAGQPAPGPQRDYVAGELAVASVELGRSNWRTVLIGGGGPGFAGLYALDVTDAAFTPDKLLFEKSGGVWGHVSGQPRIGRIGEQPGNAAWYVFSGNGYQKSPRHPAALMLVNLDTQVETAIQLPGVTGGLSAPVLLSTDDNDTVELVFAGDINGDLWMFEIDAVNPGNSQATRLYQGSPQRPITTAPAIAKYPSAPGYLVYFASNPRPGPGSAGAIQAIWINTADMAALRASLPCTDSRLQTRSLVIAPAGTATPVRVVPDHDPVRYFCPPGVAPCPALHRGWRIVLPGCHEQLTGSPRIRAGRLQFTTSGTGADCADGSNVDGNWMMSLDYVQGHDNGKAVYDINNDQVIDNRDSIKLAGVNRLPVGIHIGAGRVSPPAHVRVAAAIDSVIINRLPPTAAVNPAPGTAGSNGGRDNHVPPGAPPAVLLPVTLPASGPRVKTGRRSWIDIVE